MARAADYNFPMRLITIKYFIIEKYTNFRNKCKDDYTKTINKYNKRFGKNYKPSNFVYAPE